MRNDEELINLLYTQNMIQNIQKYMSIIRKLFFWDDDDDDAKRSPFLKSSACC